MNRPLFQSKIAKQISRRLITLHTVIYLFLLLFLLLILAPVFYREELEKDTQLQSTLAKNYSFLQNLLAESMNSFSKDFFGLIEAYEQNPSSALRARIVQALSSYAASYNNIATVGLQLPDGEYISAVYYVNLPQQELLGGNRHYQNLLSSSSNSYYSRIYPDSLVTLYSATAISHDDFVYFSKNFSNGMRFYTLTVFYNVTSFLKTNDELALSAFDSYIITDKYDELIYAEDEDLSEELYAFLEENTAACPNISGSFPFKAGRCFYERIPSTGWLVLSYVSYYRFFKRFWGILVIVAALYLLSPVIYSLFLIPLIRRQLTPLRTLSDAMSSFTAGQDIHTDIHTQNEIEDLSNVFNQMVLTVNEQIRDIQKKEHENSVVSYKLLATQIDPHFIYNTMNIINIMAHQGRNAEIVDVNTALIRILRERLNSKLNILDTVRNEYETMLQYATIMDYRYEHQILIHYDISEPLLEKLIPKNILQPLVENSFYHGFGSLEPPLSGHIDILIYSIGQDIVIEVSDDGQGMSRERLRQIEGQHYSIYADKKPHIGLNNIRQRLKYIYQDRYQMEIHSTEGIGTTTIITLPFTS